MPSPFDVETGTVLMHEPSWAKEGQLRAQLLDETYPKPFVIDDGKSRFLYFNVRLMQSEMSLKAPNDLAIRYTQKMMAFLLFQPRPKRIVLIGLGGGSLIKFCYHKMPGTQLTAVELDPIAARVEEHLLLSGMSQSKFGYVHFGDPAFIKKMREGRHFRQPMRDRLEAILNGDGA